MKMVTYVLFSLGALFLLEGCGPIFQRDPAADSYFTLQGVPF